MSLKRKNNARKPQGTNSRIRMKQIPKKRIGKPVYDTRKVKTPQESSLKQHKPDPDSSEDLLQEAKNIQYSDATLEEVVVAYKKAAEKGSKEALAWLKDLDEPAYIKPNSLWKSIHYGEQVNNRYIDEMNS